MHLRNALYVGLAAICIAFAVEAAHYAPLLPPRVATHFDAAGIPNGWMSSAAFLRDMSIVLGIAVVVFLTAGLIEKMPLQLINLPSRDHWLSPPHRAESLSYLVNWTRGFVLITLGLLVGVHGLVLQANLMETPNLGPAAMWLLGLFGVATLMMLGAIFWRFSLARTA